MKDKKATGLSYSKAVKLKQNNIGLIGTEIIYKDTKEIILDLVIVPLTKEGYPAPFILLQAVKKKDIAQSYQSYHMAIYFELSISGLSLNLFDYLSIPSINQF